MQLRTPHTCWILLFILFADTLFGQSVNPYYNFSHLNVENGLPDNTVYHFLQDSKGFMWLGTRNGITQFDGIRTINYQHNEHDAHSIAGNFVTRILEDSNQQIWIGNSAGIDLFNRENNNFTHFSIRAENGRMEDTYCVLLGFGNRYDLWFIDTKWKAIRIFNTASKKFRLVAVTDAIDGMIYVNPVSNTIDIWSYLSIGTTHYVFKKDSLISKDRFFYDGKNKLENALQVFHVLRQNDTTAWLSTAKGLIALNPVSGRYKIYNSMGANPVAEIRFATLAPNGLLWVSTGGFGVYTFNIGSGMFVDQFRNFELDPYSICSNNIISMYFDRVGNIWCGSFGEGVSYANVESRFFSKNLSKKELDPWKKGNSLYCIIADKKGNFWCILRDVLGFWILDSNLKVKEFRKPLLENGKPYKGSLYQILWDSENFAWCTTDRGLYRYNKTANKLVQVEYPRLSYGLFGSYWTNSILRLHDGSILFSTMSGLYRINTEKGRQSVQPFSELNEKPFKSFDNIFEDHSKNIYVKDIGENLYLLMPSGSPGNYNLKKQFTFPANVTQITEDNTEIYIASSQGLFLLHKSNYTIQKSPVSDNLPFNNINNLLVENDKIWFFGDKGLYYYNQTEKTGRLFTTEDGLPSNRFAEYCIYTNSSGRCITGTSNGLVSFYPGKLKDIIYPPRAQLINMYVNDSSRGFLANPQAVSNVVLQHDQNTFSFDFSCISFQHALDNKYEYKLDPYDEKWIASGLSRYTRYSKIPPGKYTFQLRTRDAKGVISPFSKILNIEIRKAFWQTNIFRFLIGAICILLIWGLIRYYLGVKIRNQQRAFEKQQAIEKERTRIATDMHDDLGAGLSSIRFLSEKVKRNSFSEITRVDIDKIMDHSSELVDKMNEIVWAMNEKNDSLGDLLVYIRSYAKEYCEENGLQCEIIQPDFIPAIFVSGETRRHVFLTIKESLHNIVKHAGASTVKMDFHVNSDLNVNIHDDGKGFDLTNKSKVKQGNGLKNMRRRIESMGGSFKIYDNSGVIIDMSIPLPI